MSGDAKFKVGDEVTLREYRGGFGWEFHLPVKLLVTRVYKYKVHVKREDGRQDKLDTYELELWTPEHDRLVVFRRKFKVAVGILRSLTESTIRLATLASDKDLDDIIRSCSDLSERLEFLKDKEEKERAEAQAKRYL